MSYAVVIARLEAAGIPFRLHDHAPLRTVAEAEAALPFPVEQMVKAVVFYIKDGPWLLVAVRAADRVDYRKLALALGVKRGALRQPAAPEVEATLGFEVGGVPPLPPDGQVQAVFDRQVLDLDRIYCGSGRRDQTLELRVPDLLRLVQPLVADVVGDRISGSGEDM